MVVSKFSIIDEFLPILIRESLNDQGGHVCSNYSPDIVVQKFKLNKPAVELQNTYHSDISKDGDGSSEMYIYVRFKNTSDQPIKGFYIHLYRNHLGLCNVPSDWSQYELKTEDGQPVYISTLGPGEIGATPGFIYNNSQNGAHPNCFVAVATCEKNPDYSSINTMSKYTQWINKTNVAARNVCVKPRVTHRQEEIFYFSNPSSQSSERMGFYVEVSGKTSSGIRYGILEKELGIKAEKTYVAGDAETRYIFCPAQLRAGYSGRLLVWYEALEGDYVDIEADLWIMPKAQSSALLAQYGIDLGERLYGITERQQTNLEPMRVILLGGGHLKSQT